MKLAKRQRWGEKWTTVSIEKNVHTIANTQTLLTQIVFIPLSNHHQGSQGFKKSKSAEEIVMILMRRFYTQSHYKEVLRCEIFIEEELRFGLDLGRLAFGSTTFGNLKWIEFKTLTVPYRSMNRLFEWPYAQKGVVCCLHAFLNSDTHWLYQTSCSCGPIFFEDFFRIP